MTHLAHAIDAYIRAKDNNRPYLMAQAFESDAALTMIVETDQISFPAEAHGRTEIASVLVTQFAQRYENVFTFCLSAPPPDDARSFECGWLVCMTEKETGAARIGYGRYDWRRADRSAKVSRLQITIEQMIVLPKDAAEPLILWAQQLPYPWCLPENLANEMPRIDAIRNIVDALTATRPESGDRAIQATR